MKNIKKHFSQKIGGNLASGAFIISVFSLALSLFGNILVTHATDLVQNNATDFNAGTYQGAEYNQGVVMKPFTGYTTNTETKLLLRMDGAGGSTTFTDSSSSARSVTTNGDTKLSAAQSKFGGTSGYFDGVGDYLSIPNSTDFLPDTGDFTVDTWIYPTLINGAWKTIWHMGTNTTNRYGLSIDSSNKLLFYAVVNGTSILEIEDPTAIIANEWYHCAVVKKGTVYSLYKNGVFIKSQTYATTLPTYTGIFAIGTDRPMYTSDFKGYMDNFRITKGRALWTSNFTPPATATQSVFLSSILNSGAANNIWSTINWIAQGIRSGNGETPASNTGLVAQWNFNETSGTTAASGGTCGASCNGTLTNMTTTGQDAAVASGWTTNNKKFGAGALMFDGTNDYVNVPNNASLNGTAGTYGLWIRIPTASTGNGYEIIGKHDITSSLNGVYVAEYQGNVGAGVKNGSGNVCAASGGWIADNRWHHITFTFSSGGTCSFYQDGVLMQSAANGAFTMSSQPLRIGRSVDSYWQAMPGTIDAVRIYSRVLSAAEVASEYQSNSIEFQTRTGNTATPDATWDSWKPVTGEAQMESFDNLYLYPTNTSGLVGYWPMDEIANGTCTGGKDACDVKNTNHATRTGTTIMDGKFGKARYFNGTSDYISAPDSADWTFGSGEFTIDTWFRSSNVAIQSIVGQGVNSGVNSSFWIGTGAAGKIRSAFATTGSTWGYIVDGNRVICDGNWHHIAMARSGNTVSYYVDGKLDVTLAVSGSIYDSSRTLAIAASNEAPMNYLNGYLDEMRIFKGVARSASAIQQDYLEGVQSLGISSVNSSTSSSIKQEGTNALKLSTGTPQIDANTVGLWHFEETGGSGAYIKDATANGNHLSINSGSPTVVDGISGKGRYFNAAASDMLHIAPTASLQPANVTVDAWVKPAAGSVSTFVQYGKGSGQSYGIETDSATGKFLCRSYKNAWYSVVDTVAPPADTWSHVACVYNGSTLSLYVNGTYRNQVADTAGLDYTSANGLNICAYWGGMYYINCMASVDEVRVSDIARDANWIAEQYRLGRDTYYNRTITSADLTSKTKIPFYIAADRPGTYLETTIGENAFVNGQCDTSTVSVWHMEEATGTGAYIKDSCGTNHGTPSGTTHNDGKTGKGRAFNGSEQYVDVTANTSFDFGTGAFTLSAWVKTTSNTTGEIIDKTATSSPYTGYQLDMSAATHSARINIMDTSSMGAVNGTKTINDGQWHHVAAVRSGSTAYLYIDGKMENSGSIPGGSVTNSFNLNIGRQRSASGYSWNGSIDEVRIDSTARSAAEIRAAYEMGLRTHPVTIDFAAKLDSGNLITGSGDTGFTVDGTGYGLIQKATGLYAADKIIIRENYNGTEYAAQGIVSTVDASTGAVTVLAWDAGSTFPAGGFTANATVMKWQRDYWDIFDIITGTGSGDAQNQKNAITNLTLRMTDGTAGRTIYFDDLRNSGGYLTDGTALNNITSSAGQYLQYRSILNSNSNVLSPSLTSVTLSSNEASTISSVSPSIGSPAGGTTVTISGTNFSAGGTGTGGTITTSGAYTVHTFTSSGTFTVPTNRNVEVMVVAGGGGGGDYGGGGGAGGLVYNSSYSASGSINVTIGNGGNGSSSVGVTGSNGQNSVFGTITAVGGGGGGSRKDYNGVIGDNGGNGGSGGGGSPGQAAPYGYGGTATSGQGNNGGDGSRTGSGWAGAGGGGAGGIGGNGIGDATGGNGGVGLAYSISGSSVYYAGGGGGCNYSSGTAGSGGNGGGGAGGTGPNGSASSGVAGIANTGGGGGGGGYGKVGGNGGSGIVIVRYLTTNPIAVTFDGISATNVKLVNSTTVTATTPAHATGSVNVVVTNTDATTATLNNGFTYGTPVTVTSVSSNTADSSYKAGQIIDVRVTFNTPVTVTAPNPTLLLETGTTDRSATYVSGSGSTVLVFSYTVQASDNSSDLEYQSTGALTTTGTIKDGSNNDANLTLPTLATANSLSGSKAIVIDTTAPTITSTAPAASSYLNTPTVSYTLSEAAASSADTKIVFTRTGGTADSSPHTCQLAGTALTTGAHTGLTLETGANACVAWTSLVDGSIYTVTFDAVDATGNSATTATNTGVTYDATPPTVINGTSTTIDGAYTTGQSIDVRVTFSEAVTVIAPNPTLLLETGTTDRNATYVSGSGSTVLVFTYTIQTGDTSNDLEYKSTGALTTTGTIKDAAGNSATLTLPTLNTANSLAGSKAIAINLAPTISSVSPTNGSAAGGTTVTITGSNFSGDIGFIKPVTVTNGTGSTLTDYQVMITTNTAALVSASKMRSDCGDLRIKDSTLTALPYWIESGCNTTTTNVWTKIPSLASGANTIYLAYGDATLTSTVNGNNVFMFFDEFSGTTLNTSKWTTTTGLESNEVSGGYLNLQAAEGVYAGNYTLPANVVFESYANPQVNSTGTPLRATDNSTQKFAQELTDNYGIDWLWWNGGLYTEVNSIESFKGNSGVLSFKKYRISYMPSDYATGTSLFNYDNGVYTGTLTNSPSAGTLHPVLYNYNGTSPALYDWIRVRKYASPLPSVSIGSEGTSIGVTFGGTAAINAIMVNSTTITATTPAHTTGAVNVVVTNKDTQTGTLTSGYTYNSPASLTSVTSNTANGTYTVGQTIDIRVNFSATVTLTAPNPTLLLETGSTDRNATYISGSGTTQLVFTYTVQDGDTSSDLEYQSTAALTTAGYIKDSEGNNITLTLPALATANSLGGSKAIVINSAPTISSVSPANGSIAGGEEVTITGTNFLLNNGGIGSGGTISYPGGYVVHTFTSNGTFSVPTSRNVEVLVVAGGGGGNGGIGSVNYGAGGGGGTVIYNSSYSASGSITVNVGNGGAGSTSYGTSGHSGGNSTFGTITATGGTGVAAASRTGGSNATYSGGTSSSGYNSGGGAGGGGDGNGTNGGPGFLSSISGIATSYAGGGAGGPGTAVDGGGSFGMGYMGGNGTTNTGGGGGGSSSEYSGGNGGSGIVIVRYRLASAVVSFGGTTATAAQWINSTTIKATAPAHSAGAVNVVVTNPNNTTGTSTNGYRYNNPVTVTAITSNTTNGSYKAGGVIDIRVTFSEAVTVTDPNPTLLLETGTTDRSATYVSGSGSTALVFNYTVQAGDTSGDLEYQSTNALTTTGSVKNGNGFDATLTLPTLNTANSLAGSKAIVIDTTAPAAPSGLSLNSPATSPDYVNTPTITVGGVVSGDTVNLFSDSGCSTQKGSATASGTTVNITSSAVTAGSNTFYANSTDPTGNKSACSTANVSYILDTSAPTVTSSSPNWSTAAGNSIAVSGTGFYSVSVVTVGGNACTGVTVSSTTLLTCTAPANTTNPPTNNVNIAVTTTNGTGTGTGIFTYYSAPTITMISPENGPIAGNTTVTITGTNFRSGETVSFGGTAATNVNFISGTKLTAVTPAKSYGPTNVVVTNPSPDTTQSATLINGYNYRSSPTVNSIVTAEGTSAGGTIITITGTNFDTWAIGTGGEVTTSGNYTVHTFTSNGTFTVPTTRNVEVLVVAGGGGGGSYGGGGGAGGVIYNSSYPTSGSINVTVGGGGAGDTTFSGTGTNGSNSVFGTITATGGGGGGSREQGWEGGKNGANGGSGGGGSPSFSGFGNGGTGIVGQGNNGGRGYGYPAAGGGGAGAIGGNTSGENAGNGGNGLAYDISGSSVYYGGGGGGCTSYGTAGNGGNGGGGKGGDSEEIATGTSGTANTGGGGGGGAWGYPGGNGGSGIVIVRYLTSGVSISFGGTTATSAQWINSTTLKATTPTHSPGLVDVVVTNPDNDTTTLTGGFRYRPIITGVTSNLTNGSYKATQVVDIRVTFNSTVTVTEPAPTLLMETGTTDRLATYASGSGTTTLVFSYTVQSGDTSSDLEYQSTSALTTTGTIKDATDGDAILTLPALNSTNSLAGSKAIVIDTTAPNAPSSLSLSSPTSSPNLISTPIISVSGVISGDTVKIFSDSSCSMQKGLGTAAGSTINITSSSLSVGSYTFYANSTDPAGNTSACSTANVAYFLYSDGPTVTSVTPSWSTTSGGNIAVEGTNFYSVSSVTVGGSACTGLIVLSATSLTCTAPAKTTNPPVNAASVVITTPAGTGTGTFTYYTAPTLTSITPNAGALEGGKSIVVVGNNFRLGASVTISGNPATLVGYVNSTTLTATTPAGLTSASVNVVVTNPAPDNQTATLTNGYTYYDLPTIDAVEPNWKTEAGGNIAFTGRNFYSVSTITVGGTTCTNRSLINQSTAICTAPAKAAGSYPISITTPSGTGTSGNILTYYAAPEVFSVSPNVGTTLGGDTITISGADFRAGATVKMVSGSGPSCTNAEAYNCNNKGLCTTIRCTTPIHTTPEAVNVVVTNPAPDNQSATLSSALNYHGPVVSSLNPASGSTAGGADVTINGSYFATNNGTPVVQSVRFNSTEATSFTVLNASTIHAVTPSHSGAGAVNVTVTNTDNSTSTLTGGFGYTLLTVSTLGNGTVDYYLAANTNARLTFNFSLDAASRQAVQNTLMIGASDYLNFTWSNNNTILDFSSANAITFDFDVVVILHDPVSGQPVSFLLVDSAIKTNQILAGTSTTLNHTQNEAVLLTSQEINLNVPSGVNDATINVAPLFSGVSGDLPAITATSASIVNNPEGGQNCDAAFDIAAETTVTGDSGWDKTIGAPVAKPLDSVTVEPSSEDSTTIVRSVTEVGSPTKRLGFSKGVRVLIKCQAGRLAAFEINNTVTKIMDTCPQDSRVAGNALPTNGACQIDVGNDKVIWTRHFSDFITYDEYSNPTVTGTSPAQGTSSGGTTVTITGTNFGTGSSVRFGEAAGTGIDVISETTLTAITPAHDSGTVDVIVTTPSGNSGTQQNAYTYFDTLTVTTKGNGTTDYTLAADTQSRLTFNFSLDSTARTAVQNAINAGTNKTMSFSWSGYDQILDFYSATETTFDNDVVATVTGEDITADLLLINSALGERQMTASALTSITENQTQAVITDTNEIVINIPLEVTNSSLNIDPITTDTSGTLPKISINANTSAGTVNIVIPAGSVVTGASGWNSVINMPTIKENSSVTVTPDPGKFATVNDVIEIGSGNTNLTFDKGIRIVFGGKAGKYVGYSRNGTFTAITGVCSADDQTTGDALPSGGDCKTTSGSDLIVWTKHFTDFVVYDQNFPPDITNVVPSSGTTAGGTHVTVNGSNFGTGLTLTFGGTPATNIDVMNNTQIAADTPAHSAGTVGVTVTNTNDGTDTLANGFIFFTVNPPAPGQSQEGGQNYTQEIICPQNPIFSISKVPGAVNWDQLSVSGNAQHSYDTAVSNDTPIPNENILTITDTRSGGNDECPLNQRGFIVQAQLSSPLSNGNTIIPSSNLRIITSNEGLTTTDEDQAGYSLPSGTGNLHNVIAPVLYDDFTRSTTTVWNKFRSPEAYIYAATSDGTAANPSGTPGTGTDLNNALNGTVDLLKTYTGHNAEISTGIILKLTIPGNQDPGVYTGTVTYTLMAQD